MVCALAYFSLVVTYWETFHKFDSLTRRASCTSCLMRSHTTESARTCSQATAFFERTQAFEWRMNANNNHNKIHGTEAWWNKRSQHLAEEYDPFRHKFAYKVYVKYVREFEPRMIWQRNGLHCVSAHCASDHGSSGFQKWYQHFAWVCRCWSRIWTSRKVWRKQYHSSDEHGEYQS